MVLFLLNEERGQLVEKNHLLFLHSNQDHVHLSKADEHMCMFRETKKKRENEQFYGSFAIQSNEINLSI